MGNNHHVAEVTAEQIQKAKSVWNDFTRISKWSVLSIIGVLVLLAITLL